jgi:zinc transport system substrate-binding protein
LLAVVLASGTAGAVEPLRVTVTIPPLLQITRAIGGDAAQVDSFMTEDDDPHTFTPSPKAVARLGRCDVLVTVGVGFEEEITAKVRRMFPQLLIVDAAKGLDTDVGHAAEADDDHDHHAHEHGPDCALHDPHIWLSIPRLIHMAETLRDALADVQPERKAHFEANFARLKAEYGAAHERLTARLKAARGTTFYVYHPAFGYFAQDYELKQKSVEIDGKSPAPRQLMHLIKQARRDGVRVIFVQPQFNSRPARILAERIGGRVVPLNPLSGDPLGTMREAADTIAEVR